MEARRGAPAAPCVPAQQWVAPSGFLCPRPVGKADTLLLYSGHAISGSSRHAQLENTASQQVRSTHLNQAENEPAFHLGSRAPNCSASTTATCPPSYHRGAVAGDNQARRGWAVRSRPLVSRPELSTAPALGSRQEAGRPGTSGGESPRGQILNSSGLLPPFCCPLGL